MGYKENNDIGEGLEYSMRVDAKGARGEGIGRIGNFVIFVKNAKTRIGNVYKVKVTKIHRTFAYAELKDSKQQFIGNGSLVDFG
ncbi:MAG: TRAM domain-containing protein [Candidatus Micrarchaeaceae archaeon]